MILIWTQQMALPDEAQTGHPQVPNLQSWICVEGPFRWCALAAPLSTGAVASHPRHLRQVPWAGKRSARPGTPLIVAVARTGRGTLAPAVRQHHLCPAAIKECGASPVGPQAPPAPVPRQSWGGQAVCLCDLEAALPWPVSPLVGSVSGSPCLPTRAQSTGLTHSPRLPSNCHV